MCMPCSFTTTLTPTVDTLLSLWLVYIVLCKLVARYMPRMLIVTPYATRGQGDH